MNPKLGLLYLVGPTPGPVHSYCMIHDSWLVNRRHALAQNPPPVPTWFPSEDAPASSVDSSSSDYFDQDIYHEMLHRSDDETIFYEGDSGN
ncbi:unnamed protein product [Echinostoma caproni]|uniref:Cysteine protease n=1 Tax=Echinostoma caproni TaxID=27848 RepID=A0A183AE48_9TREM|nr:unnamed protein product [Echinostoma caproni]